jgi:hypothetical protein
VQLFTLISKIAAILRTDQFLMVKTSKYGLIVWLIGAQNAVFRRKKTLWTEFFSDILAQFRNTRACAVLGKISPMFKACSDECKRISSLVLVITDQSSLTERVPLS